jgi:hypothetical protein
MKQHRLLLVTTIVIFFFLCFEINCAAREISLGLASADGYQAHADEVTRLGDVGDHVLLYYTLGQADLLYQRYSEELDIILTMKFPEYSSSLLAAIVAGNFDSMLTTFGQNINDLGRPITVRPMHEINGDWYPWQAYYENNSIEDVVPAFQRVVKKIRNHAGGLVKFDINYNRKSANTHDTSDFQQLYPGDEYVDKVSITSYNRCGTSIYHTEPKSFAEEFRPAYETILELTERPIGVGETSTTSFCEVDKMVWFRDLLKTVVEEFERVDNISFFFETVEIGEASNDVLIEWGISPDDEADFSSLIDEFRLQLRGKQFSNILPSLILLL